MSEGLEPSEGQAGGAGGAGGAAGSAAPHTDLRTFMIADIRGYTTYTRERGDEAGAALASQFGEIVAEVVPRHEGFLVELRGDEALVVFVSARKALRAAVELQDRFAALPRGVGIGLDAGEAIPVGSGYRGTALNLAARLSGQALAGETLASEAVIHLAAKMDGISYVDARDLKLKGYAQAVRAVVVLPSDRAKGHRLASDRRSGNSPRAVLVGVTFVVVLALVGTFVGTILLNDGGLGNVAATPSPSRPLGGSPSSLPTLGAPTSSSDPLGGRLPVLAFFDAATGAFRATTSIESPRNISFYAGGYFWILTDNPTAFKKIDPTTHEVVDEINVPVVDPSGYNSDEDYIWVTDLSGPRVVRIDQRSGTWTSFDVGLDESDTAAAFDVTVGDGSVWLSRPDVYREAEDEFGEITRMDRQTGEVQARIPVRAFGVTYGADALWYWIERSIGRVDSVTNEPSFDPVELSPDAWLGNIYFAGGDAWTPATEAGLIYRVDNLGRHTNYQLQPGVGDMAPAASTMWVTNVNTGVLTGIDVATGQQSRTIDTGHAVLAVASGGDEIMIGIGLTADEAIAGLPGSVLRVATNGIPWWDPAPDPPIAGSWQVRQALYLTCANLLNYQDKAGPEGLELVPEVAAEMPTVSDDGKTYTFTIRPGFKFSPPSNESVTADTFRYTIERALSPVFGDDEFGPHLFGDIVGAQEYRAKTASSVAGVVVTGDQLQITLQAPAPDILDRLASSVACPVPINGTPVLRFGLKSDPPVSGAGPYYLAQTFRRHLVVLKKNPNYSGDRPQPFDAIAIRTQVARETALGMIQNGQLDAVMFDPWDPLTGAGSALAVEWGPGGAHATAGDQRWFGALRTGVGFLALNPTSPVLQDADVRHAISLAINREEISRIWVEAPGAELLNPSVRGSDQGAAATPPDLEAALELMNGRSLTVTLEGEPNEDCQPCHDFEQAIKRQLANIGIIVNIRNPDEDEDPAPGEPGSDFDLIGNGTGADYPDPVAALSGLHDIGWIGQSNLDELTRLEGVSGQERIDGIAALAHRLVHEEFLIVPTNSPVFPFFISDRMGCGFVQPALGAVDLLSLCVKDAAATPAPSASP